MGRRRRIKKNARSPITAIAPAATPMPMPALAPVESPDEPDEPDESVEVSEDVAAALVVVAVFVAGVPKSVDCHAI